MTPLEAYAAHCHRTTPDKHPTVWARHIDIWEMARGEIGVPDGLTSPKVAAYGALVPWMLCPEIMRADLIIAQGDIDHTLAWITLSVSAKGTLVEPRHVTYGIDDRGRFSFGEARVHAAPPEIRGALSGAIKARLSKVAWDEMDYDRALHVAAEMVTSYE